MKWIEKFSIRNRLGVLLIFSAVSLCVLGGFSSWTILRVSTQATGFIDHEFEAVRVVGEVQTAIGNARRFEKDVLLTMGDDRQPFALPSFGQPKSPRSEKVWQTLGR